MKRRTLFTSVFVLLASPWAGQAQPRKARIGFLGGTAPDASMQRVWVNGRQVADGRGVMKGAPLAGELLTRFSA